MLVRSRRSTPLRSRTSAFGSATTRGQAPTTCTRSTARPRGLLPSRRCTPIWPPATALGSGRSTYEHRPPLAVTDPKLLTPNSDPPCRRAREDRGHQAPLHQATRHQEPLVPSPPPCSQDQERQAVQRDAPVHLCLRGFFMVVVGVGRFFRCSLGKWDILHLLR